MTPEMSDPEADDYLDPALSPEERAELSETARLLEEHRPVPRPAFRGQLARRLRTRSRRPSSVRRLIAAYAGSGFALLLVAAIGLAGVGPLAS
jgi:ferric-dicitrate binding protein FerR (iron transport regulator)